MSLKHSKSLLLNQEIKNGWTIAVNQRVRANQRRPLGFSGLPDKPSLVTQQLKNPPAVQETWVGSLGWEDLLEKGKGAHFSILAWRIPWTVQSMGLQRVGYDSATFTSIEIRFYLWNLLFKILNVLIIQLKDNLELTFHH